MALVWCYLKAVATQGSIKLQQRSRKERGKVLPEHLGGELSQAREVREREE